MSTPMVTAACAMAYAYAKNPDILAIRERILANVTINANLAGRVATGGILNVYDAVKDLAENAYTYTSPEKEQETEKSEDDKTTEDTQQTTGNPLLDYILGRMPDSDRIDEDINETTDSEEASVVGKLFIQNGAIYKITSDTTAAVTGVADSTENTIEIEDTVTYNSKSYLVTQIRDKAFYKNQSVIRVEIGANVKTIGKQAFIGCKKLKTVTGMEAVTEIKAGAFRGCKKLKNMVLLSHVTSIANTAFRGCKKLKVTVVKGSYAAKYAKKKGISTTWLIETKI